MGSKRGIFVFSSYDKAKKKVVLAFIILIIGLILFSSYFLFFYNKKCLDESCFIDAMKNCKRVSWIKGNEQANWLYTIKGSEDDLCTINVRLLEIKEGTIDSGKLEGKEMTCIVPKGNTEYPEKDMSKCTGILKEELQDIIIQNMHDYLLANTELNGVLY